MITDNAAKPAIEQFWNRMESAIDTPQKRREVQKILKADRRSMLDDVTPFEMLAGVHQRMLDIEPLVPLFNLLRDNPKVLAQVFEIIASCCVGPNEFIRPYFVERVKNIRKQKRKGR